MSVKFKIGVDYHGVITANPSFFKDFNRLALEHGGGIFVLTGGKKQDVVRFLKAHQILYSDVWSILDFYDVQHLVTYFDDGSFKVDDNLWNTAKAAYCLENKIDFHIDDSPLYAKAFQTPFCLYDIGAKICQVQDSNGLKIDFKQAPEKVLGDILEHIGLQKPKF